MITTNDICKSVAAVIPELQNPCMSCMGYKRSACTHCDGLGWQPSKQIDRIITNVKYPLTIVLKNDMIGWSAEVALDGDGLKTNGNRQAFDSPVDAVYEALFEALTDKLGAGRMGEYESMTRTVPKQPTRPKRTTRGRGRPIKSAMTVQESVKWLQPGSES